MVFQSLSAREMSTSCENVLSGIRLEMENVVGVWKEFLYSNRTIALLEKSVIMVHIWISQILRMVTEGTLNSTCPVLGGNFSLSR